MAWRRTVLTNDDVIKEFIAGAPKVKPGKAWGRAALKIVRTRQNTLELHSQGGVLAARVTPPTEDPVDWDPMLFRRVYIDRYAGMDDHRRALKEALNVHNYSGGAVLGVVGRQNLFHGVPPSLLMRMDSIHPDDVAAHKKPTPPPDPIDVPY